MQTIQKYRIDYVCENKAVFKEKTHISKSEDVKKACLKYLKDSPIEHILVYALDSQNCIIGFTAQEGDVDQCKIYVKQIFRFLLSAGAVSFVVAHNHPGETIEASEGDWKVTKHLKKAGEIFEIPLLDHVIVAGEKIVSLRDLARWKV